MKIKIQFKQHFATTLSGWPEKYRFNIPEHFFHILGEVNPSLIIANMCAHDLFIGVFFTLHKGL